MILTILGRNKLYNYLINPQECLRCIFFCHISPLSLPVSFLCALIFQVMLSACRKQIGSVSFFNIYKMLLVEYLFYAIRVCVYGCEYIYTHKYTINMYANISYVVFAYIYSILHLYLQTYHMYLQTYLSIHNILI